MSRPHYTNPRRDHPGASEEEILNEPNWGATHGHRIGFHDSDNRRPGLTHEGDEWQNDDERNRFLESARKDAEHLQHEIEEGHLVTVRDVMTNQEDYHLRFPEDYSKNWRYLLHTTEDFIKNQPNWPANIKKRQQEESKKTKEAEQQEPRKEHEWRRERGEVQTHNDAYADQKLPVIDGEEDKKKEDEEQILKNKYSPQELQLLRVLQYEKNYIVTLQENDGTDISPVAEEQAETTIDEADQFTPDNWIPRSTNLIRLTGKHPFNGESELNALYSAGLITPNSLHYVRNHGPVPHLHWETHTIDIQHGKLNLSMDSLKRDFNSINIPVVMACDGNRRKELNMIRRSTGFHWGPGGVGCAYWKGVLLCDILREADIQKSDPKLGPGRLWVHFEGTEDCSEGKYATCIPLEYAMDPNNDVLLAYEMNNKTLPPDHGYPVRVIIPGYVGGRCVKWLAKIWVSNKENDSYYHLYDNRILPSFVLDKDSEFAHTMFTHPSTACQEQNLNCFIVRPAQGETIPLSKVANGKSYRVEGIAYNGSGHEIQRVEISLNGGKDWLYCIRKFPDRPIRHGKKFWTWLHWHIDVNLSHLVRAESITVRCFNVFKSTQPEHPIWNLSGMMNNCWYIVRPEIQEDLQSGCSSLFFRHPCEPVTGKEGWMKPSYENQIEEIRHEVVTPQKQFTREEIEKHNSENDCWIVINNNVYDGTSVLSWHPGGKAAIMAHAGKAHFDTTDEFESIHDDYAQLKLSECILGVVTDKCREYIKKQAEVSAREEAESVVQDKIKALKRHRWTQVRLVDKEKLSEDTRRYTFALPKGMKSLGLITGQHIQLGFHFSDKLVVRPYTPIRPILIEEEDGTFDLVVKTYFPNQLQPGGTMSNILDCLRPGEEVEIKGPSGAIKYFGHGNFVISGKEFHFTNVSLILGGSGITPGFQLIKRILSSHETEEEPDGTNLKVVYANNTEEDILLHSELTQLAKEYVRQFQVTHVLSKPKEEWRGEKGFVTKEILQRCVFEPSENNAALLCGPPAMIQKAVLPALKEWGYHEDENLFGF